MQPWHNNLNKRIVKSPKLYFYDTGLLCFLLAINNIAALIKHTRYGAIVENWVITEIKKNRTNKDITGGMNYFRDSAGNEIDLVLEKNNETIGIEIKVTKKPSNNDLHGIKYWQKYQPNSKRILIHGGNKNEMTDDSTSLLPWHSVGAYS